MLPRFRGRSANCMALSVRIVRILYGTNSRRSDLGEQPFIRVERQTPGRLPVSGDVLFTIRIHADRMPELARHPDGAVLANGLRE